MKNKNILYIALFGLFSTLTQAQQGFGTSNPNTNSVIDLTATNKGLLMPRIDLVATNNFAPLTAHVAGMTVYNTATTNDVSPGYYYNDGVKWIKAGNHTGSGTPTITNVTAGDIYVNTTTGDIYTYDGTTWNMVGSPDADLTNDEFINNVAANRVELGKDSDGTTNRPIGTEFVIQDDGNVGIGTSSPDQKLTVNGQISFLGDDNQNNTGVFYKNNELFMHTYGTVVTENLFVGLRSGNLSLNTVIFPAAPEGGNTGIGTDALSSLTVGAENTGIGTGALNLLTTGNRNTAVGYIAMRSALTTGSGNTALGTRAMQTISTGNRNTAVGDYTLRDITTGSFNTVLGAQAGSLNGTAPGSPIITTGSNNTLIGALSNFVSTTQYTNASAIGYRAAVGQSNSMVLGSIDGINGATADTNVGLGTTTPNAKLHVVKVAADITPAIIEGCNVYADNAAAATAGVPVGGLYRTATGQLMVRF